MAVDFKQVKLKIINEGIAESQARNRYTFASRAKKEEHHIIEAIFKFTADGTCGDFL